MRRFLARVWLRLRVAAFTVAFVVALPIILLQFATGSVQDWIEARWPESYTARAIAFWLKVLVPVVVMLLLIVAFAIAAFWVRGQIPAQPAVAD